MVLRTSRPGVRATASSGLDSSCLARSCRQGWIVMSTAFVSTTRAMEEVAGRCCARRTFEPGWSWPCVLAKRSWMPRQLLEEPTTSTPRSRGNGSGTCWLKSMPSGAGSLWSRRCSSWSRRRRLLRRWGRMPLWRPGSMGVDRFMPSAPTATKQGQCQTALGWRRRPALTTCEALSFAEDSRKENAGIGIAMASARKTGRTRHQCAKCARLEIMELSFAPRVARSNPAHVQCPSCSPRWQVSLMAACWGLPAILCRMLARRTMVDPDPFNCPAIVTFMAAWLGC